MRVFRNKWFSRFARKTGITDKALAKAVFAAEDGLIDADLGGGVIKQRIARSGTGKSGGFRTIVLFRTGMRAFFVYGFSKNDRDNIDADELAAFRDLAAVALAQDDAALDMAVKAGIWMEIRDEPTIP